MATKTPQICIFDNEKQHFCTLCTCIFHFLIFVDFLVLSTTWNELFCSCVDDVSIWWQMFNFVFLCPKRWFQINSRTFRRHFSSIMALNNWKMIAENRSYIFRWRSRFRRRRVCLSSLMTQQDTQTKKICSYAFPWGGSQAYTIVNHKIRFASRSSKSSPRRVPCETAESDSSINLSNRS